jgi:hypothetical protein
LDRPGRQIAQEESALAEQRGLDLQHGIVLVERVVAHRQISKVGGDKVNLPLGGHGLERLEEPQDLEGHGTLLGLGEEWYRGMPTEFAGILVALAEDAADARVDELYVRGRAAVHRQHFVPIEDVIARAGAPPGAVKVVCWVPNLAEAGHARNLEAGLVVCLAFPRPIRRIQQIRLGPKGMLEVKFGLAAG